MSQRFYGSIDVTAIIQAAQAGHSSMQRSQKNNKVYANVTLWVNDEPDAYKNDASIQLSSAKDHPDGKVKIYLGNLKKAESGGGAPLTANAPDIANVNLDDLPF